MTEKELNLIKRRFIEDAGNTTQSFGLGRVTGQIYAYLYFSDRPRNLGDMQDALGISKGSASTVVRQLEQWHAVRKVWIKGDRKDYYQADDWFGRIFKNAMQDIVGKRISDYSALVEQSEEELSDLSGDSELEFVKERIAHIRDFQQKAGKVWKNPILQRLLK